MKLARLIPQLGVSLSTLCFITTTQAGIPLPGGQDNLTKVKYHGILRASTENLALSVNNPTLNAALTGNSRIITITNTGEGPATDLVVNYPEWPAGSPSTSASDNCTGSTLAPGGSCTITVVPGTIATSGAGDAACTTGIAPTPGVISVTAHRSKSASTNVVVLGYGCIYQGGYIYSVDDTTANAGSIGGTIVAQADSTTTDGIVWDSSSDCASNPYTGCYTTNATSMTNGTNLASPPPGGNSYLIYQTLTAQNSELPSTYAAGLCTSSSMEGYNDWYLPAICEMGYEITFGGINCGGQSTPVQQNMQSNLIDNNIFGGLTTGGSSSYPAHYWSSTEYNEDNIAITACYSYFASAGNSAQYADGLKNVPFGVRCSRALTQ